MIASSGAAVKAGALANIREAIELYLEPAALKLSEGAITREVVVE